jgi:peptidoglycan/xylan/chitin deacetylase (PgdA/CDA1 family)/nucleoid-associated protein YgaU
MDRSIVTRVALLGGAIMLLGACAAARPGPEVAAPTPPPAPAPAPEPEKPARLPEVFESGEFAVVLAKGGDTPEALAARFLGDPAKAWMIEEYNDLATLSPGQEIVIPKRPWNLSGVETTGYQLVPVLVYHNIAARAQGRLVIAARAFEEQMRYLKAEGYRVAGLADLLEFTALKRQLRRKTVVLTFDDGWKSFRQFAEPVLKELGFTATLFIYTDFIGGRSALSWDDLRELAGQGFDIEAHTKTHGDLRRSPEESESEYARRMQAELSLPLTVLQRQLGRQIRILAYPYGSHDDAVLKWSREYGYVAAFDVRRQANPSFGQLLTLHRSQIYADMTLEDFARNLNVFGREVTPLPEPPAPAATPVRPPAASPIEALGAKHWERAQALEREGRLRQALEESKIALTIDADSASAREGEAKLETRIEQGVADRMRRGREAVSRGDDVEARRQFLGALALDPANRSAFQALQTEVKEVRFITHKVRPGETLAGLAQRYYGDRSRSEVIWEVNQLPPNPRLVEGTSLRIPEIPGVPFVHETAPAPSVPPPSRSEPAPPGPPEENEIHPLLIEAKDALEKGQYTIALAEVDKFLVNNAKRPDGVDLKKAILYGLGKSQLGQQKYGESYRTFSQLVALAPDYQDAPALLRQARDRAVQQHMNQGLRFFQEEKLEEAIAQWRAVLEYDPEYANAKRNIEQAQRLLRNLQQRQQPKGP